MISPLRILTLIGLFMASTLFAGQSALTGEGDRVNGASTPAAPDTVETKDCTQKDIADLFRKKGKPPKPPKTSSVIVLPNISSNPANGLLLGVGGSVGWFWGDPENTRVSFMGFTAAYTTKKQVLIFVKSNVYTPGNRFFLQGDWRFYKYGSSTYGLGTNAPDTTNLSSSWYWQGLDIEETEGAFPMLYNFIKFHQMASYELADNIYAGLGYQLDVFNRIEDERLALVNDTILLTPHYYYNVRRGFSTEKYTLSGVGFNFLYDTRDNLINAYKGYFVFVNYRVNTSWLGSNKNSSQLWLEYRSYHSLSAKRPRHLIAFWLFGNFLISGEQPYLTLMATSEDQKARAGRGYVQGRYRGEDYIYGEVEYRFPILPCSQILGGVLFVNAQTVSNRQRDLALFEVIRPAVGFGFRFMINKTIRTNINFDFAIGYKSKAFYFSGAETF